MGKRAALAAGVAVMGAWPAPGPADALVVTYMWESGGNVEAAAMGTLNLTGATRGNTFAGPEDFRIEPRNSEVFFFGTGDLHHFPGLLFPDFGTGALKIQALPSEGDRFGWELTFNRARTTLMVPVGFVSGGSISSTGRMLNSSFATLGITKGVYELELPQDKLVLRVGEAPGASAAVALPAALPLAAAGFGLLGLMGLRRRG